MAQVLASQLAHVNRGFEGIYLGPSPKRGSLAPEGHLVLRAADRKIVQVRTVKCYKGEYPFKPSPQLSRFSSGGACNEVDEEKHDQEDSDVSEDEHDQDNKSNNTSVDSDSSSLDDDDSGELKLNEAEAEEAAPAVPLPKSGDTFPPGTVVMTTAGECVVVHRYDDGDYCVRYNTADVEPADMWTVKRKEIWSLKEYPDWNFGIDGKYVRQKKQRRLPTKKMKRVPKNMLQKAKESECLPTQVESQFRIDGPAGRTRSRKQPVTSSEDSSSDSGEDMGPAGRTRSRAKLAKAMFSDYSNSNLEYRRYDENGGSKSMRYPPVNIPTPKSSTVAKRGVWSSNTTPEGLPIQLSPEELAKMDAIDVAPLLPKHFHQTFSSALRNECEDGEIKELQDCLNREVWGKPQKKPEDAKVIGLMWVYTVKATTEKKYARVRSRITLMGNQERSTLAALDAYAPVAQMVTGRLLLAMHLHDRNVQFRKLDVKNAYINEFMRRFVLCKVPPGYKASVKNGTLWLERLKPGEKQDPDICLPLLKALYGGMECGRIFWESWVDWHLADGFQIIHEERCFLHKRGDDGSWIKLVYHVDDNMIATLGEQFYQSYLARLRKKFDVEEGELDHHLGTMYKFDREAGTCIITQEAQVEKLLKEFDMQNCNPVDVPCLSGPLPCEADCEEPYDGKWDMQSFEGHVLYLYMCTRPDIGHVVKVLSRFTTKFGKKHVQFAKHLLRYLKGTSKRGLTYRSEFPPYYQVFTDASHASCVDTRRSISSIVIKLGGNTVYWKNSFSKIVSHSSTESELMALDLGATVGECLRWLVQSMGGAMQDLVRIFVDNQGSIKIGSNPVQSGRNLHVHARYFYVRDLVYDGQYDISYLPTDLQLADVGCSFKGGLNFLTLRRYLLECARVVHDEHGTPSWELGDDAT